MFSLRRCATLRLYLAAGSKNARFPSAISPWFDRRQKARYYSRRTGGARHRCLAGSELIWRLQFTMRVIGSRKGSKIALLRECTMAAGVLIFLPPSGAPANCVAHCLLIQRGMEANAQGSSVAEWSESSGILREDLGTVEAPLDSIDSECEKTKQNFLESPSVSKKERVERYVRLHTLGIDDHLDLVPASSWTADKTNPKLIVKIEPPRCK
jgi:hypothetical protein